jgi:NAD(P)-dependent dehydrogenase (short-subunit alcohol dehydrogenase family)
VHGDWDSTSGDALDSALNTLPAPNPTTFLRTDVTSYTDLLALFEAAWAKHGRVDIAISNAGLQEAGHWFDPALDRESVKTLPTTKCLDVNLLGTLYFARIAAVYLASPSPSSTTATSSSDRALILLSSTAGFKETPGLPVYSAAKHGVLGLLRALRLSLPATHGVRVNAVCPWMTDTAMVDGIREQWLGEGLPVNSPESVGRVVCELAGGREWNGRAVFVEGGRGWDIEEGIGGTEGVWLGEEVAGRLRRGQAVLGDGTGWGRAAV